MDRRLERLNDEEKEELFELFEALSNSSKIQNENVIGKLYRLMDKTDSYELIDHKNEMIEFQQKVYQKVWDEAKELRHDEKLIEYARGLDCPVVAIHGAYDPHPYEGVKEPLSDILDDFKFVLLDRCGHYPWYERYARDEFLQIIRDELE
ncbi:MAG: alpha/beta fold hydrolase [Thermoplasmatota archaeon]